MIQHVRSVVHPLVNLLSGDGVTARLLRWWSSGDGDRSKVRHDTEKRDESSWRYITFGTQWGGGLIRID